MDKTHIVLKEFINAREQLREVLFIPVDDIVRDSAIHRYELTFGLSWKLLKIYLEEYKGVLVSDAPKDIFRQAYKAEVLAYNQKWLELVDILNKISDIYSEDIANEVYEQLPKALACFNTLTDKVKIV